MTQLIIGFTATLLTIIYILIGWFIRSLVQDDWEEPSLLLALLWPPLILIIGVVKLFTLVEDLATKIKEKNDV